MKKIIFSVIGGLVIGALVSPVVGMAISSTRSLILGMAPDEAILTLADKIDEQRIVIEQSQAENNQKTKELQSVVVDQQTQLAEQKQMIDEQAKTNAENRKAMECQAIQKKASWCSEEKYTLPLDSYLKQVSKENPPAMESKEVVAAAKRSWNTCQELYKEYAANGCD